jgi:hypothetical protein
MDSDRLDELRRLATDFRAAIERSLAERATPALPYFPDGACRLVSRLFAIHLTRRPAWPAATVRFVSARLPGHDAYVRHTWLASDDAIVDLTADPFGEPPVIVGAETAFHARLADREDEPADAVLTGMSGDELNRLKRLLGPIEARLPPDAASTRSA